MALNDSIQLGDSLRIAYWRNNPEYDYNSELYLMSLDSDNDIFSIIAKWIGKLFDLTYYNRDLKYLWIVVFLIITGFIVWLFIVRNKRLFNRSKRNNYAADGEDTIYGIDFDRQIAKAKNREDFYEMARLTYLHTLKKLNDAGLIVWELYKTPTQYLYEVNDVKILARLRPMTNQFLRIRYGKYIATLSISDEMMADRNTIAEYIAIHEKKGEQV